MPSSRKLVASAPKSPVAADTSKAVAAAVPGDALKSLLHPLGPQMRTPWLTPYSLPSVPWITNVADLIVNSSRDIAGNDHHVVR
ncbi:MAG: hypothetical protein HY827_01700 [Actinobacteria bacterium]|nr:hypothetical protein [Actinomycetota bacterium]